MQGINYNSIFQSFCFCNVTRDKWDNKKCDNKKGKFASEAE